MISNTTYRIGMGKLLRVSLRCSDPIEFQPLDELCRSVIESCERFAYQELVAELKAMCRDRAIERAVFSYSVDLEVTQLWKNIGKYALIGITALLSCGSETIRKCKSCAVYDTERELLLSDKRVLSRFIKPEGSSTRLKRMLKQAKIGRLPYFINARGELWVFPNEDNGVLIGKLLSLS